MFDLAQDIGLPVCIFIPGNVEHLPRYLTRYPKLTVILDHRGMGFPNIPFGRSPEDIARTLDRTYFDTVLALGEYPNVAIKWSHVQDRFGAGPYPYEPARPLLRKAIESFGADCLLRVSDQTVLQGHT